MQTDDVLQLNPYDTIVLILQASKGSLSGRTALQKLAYLSVVKTRKIEDLGFKAHYYGPYSAKLSLSLANMISYSFLEETHVPGKMYGGYRYKLTDDGKKIAEKIKENHQGIYEEIKGIVETCRKFCNLESAPLSYASKIHYILYKTSQNTMTEEEAIKCAKDLGWDVTKDDVKQGVELLQKLKLVKYTE